MRNEAGLATIDGSALASTGAVTLDTNTIDNSNCVTTSSTVIPEPGSFVIFGVSLAGLIGCRKRLLFAA